MSSCVGACTQALCAHVLARGDDARARPRRHEVWLTLERPARDEVIAVIQSEHARYASPDWCDAIVAVLTSDVALLAESLSSMAAR